VVNGPFKGFGFTDPAVIADEASNAFQRQIAQAQNPSQARLAIATQAGQNLAGGSRELQAAKKKAAILERAKQRAPQTGDARQDQMAFLKEAQRIAMEEGMPEVAISATDQLSVLQNEQEERSRLQAQSDRADRQVELAEKRFSAQEAEARLNRRNEIANVRVNAYDNVFNATGDKEQAENAAREATMAYLSSLTESGTSSDAIKMAREEGLVDLLTIDGTDIDTDRNLTQSTGREFKGLTTVPGEDGTPVLAKIMELPNGEVVIEPTSFTDLDAQRRLQGGAGGKITDAQRKAAGNYLLTRESTAIIDGLSANGFDFGSTGTASGLLLPEALQPGQIKSYEDAMQNWVMTHLRDVSGATIGKEEAAKEVKRFFPSVGDGPVQVEAKARFRQAYEGALQARAGSQALEEAYIIMENQEIASGNEELAREGM
jgi:hypothetical protein